MDMDKEVRLYNIAFKVKEELDRAIAASKLVSKYGDGYSKIVEQHAVNAETTMREFLDEVRSA